MQQTTTHTSRSAAKTCSPPRDPWYWRRLVHELERAGLQAVAADGRIRVYRGATAAAWGRKPKEAPA